MFSRRGRSPSFAARKTERAPQVDGVPAGDLPVFKLAALKRRRLPLRLNERLRRMGPGLRRDDKLKCNESHDH
jgi:hypothetical protein